MSENTATVITPTPSYTGVAFEATPATSSLLKERLGRNYIVQTGKPFPEDVKELGIEPLLPLWAVEQVAGHSGCLANCGVDVLVVSCGTAEEVKEFRAKLVAELAPTAAE